MKGWDSYAFLDHVRDHPIDALIEVLLIGLLAFMPFAYGATLPWTEMVVACVVSLMLACLLIRTILRGRDGRSTWSGACVIVAVFILYSAAQLAPLPTAFVKIISPNTVRLRHELLGDLPNASAILSSVPISFYSHATQHDLRTVLEASAVFFIVMTVFRSSDQIRRLLMAITIIGGCVAILQAAQYFTNARRIYWIGPEAKGDLATAGPFYHYSHFGQFVNLSIGAAISLMVVSLRKLFRRKGYSPEMLGELWRRGKLRVPALLVAFIVLAAVTIFLSASRSAIAGLLAGFGFSIWSLSRVRNLPGRGWVLVPIALLLACMLGFMEFNGISERLAALGKSEAYVDRWQILKDLSVEWKQYPITGTGLGTHEWVYPLYDRSTNFANATFAENEYAQLMEETGLIGVALVGVFVGMIAWNYFKAIAFTEPSIRLAAIGLGYGLVATMAHSITDFGQHLPANACLAAVFCGLIVRLARIDVRSSQETEPAAEREPAEAVAPFPWRHLVGSLGLGAACVWAVVACNQVRASAAVWKQTVSLDSDLQKENWQGTSAQFTQLLHLSDRACALDPSDVQQRLFCDWYRWAAASQNIDLQTGGAVSTATSTTRMQSTAAAVVRDLDGARTQCPTYGELYQLLAQMQVDVLNNPAAGLHMTRLAFLLNSRDAEACFAVARADAIAGQLDRSIPEFRRYLELSQGFTAVADVFIRECNRPQIALDLAGQDSSRLSQFADVMAKCLPDSPLIAQCRARSFEMLKTQCADRDAPAEMLIKLAHELVQRDDSKGAVDCYRRALATDYGQVGWHFELAQLLAQSGDVSQAMNEARICLRLHPEMSEARQLLGDLSVLPQARVSS